MNRNRLFLASRIALIVTSMSFAIRGDLIKPLGEAFGLSGEQIGWAAAPAFWGFALAALFGGPLCDVLGMGKLLALAFVGHLTGIVLTIYAGGFWTLFLSTMAMGIANGLVEAACNPLVATLFPEEKTKRLNQFHVWFPGGIVIGGLVAYAFTHFGIGWQWKMASMLLPLAIYGFLFIGQKFPQTERVASGVKTGEMFAACGRPLFLTLVFCMLLTATTELGTTQWVSTLMQSSAGLKDGILVLVWINLLMAVGRQFAGPVVHRISPTGVLLASAVLACLGLLWLSVASGVVMVFAAATVFAAGVCYFWPTMLGVTAERVPRAGALGLALMGGAGMFSTSLSMPVMGGIYDTQGAGVALRYMAILPVILTVVFAVLFFRDKARGGYKAESIHHTGGGDVGFEAAPQSAPTSAAS